MSKLRTCGQGKDMETEEKAEKVNSQSVSNGLLTWVERKWLAPMENLKHQEQHGEGRESSVRKKNNDHGVST